MALSIAISTWLLYNSNVFIMTDIKKKYKTGATKREGGGGQVKFYPYKKGMGKVLAMLKGRHKKCWCRVLTTLDGGGGGKRFPSFKMEGGGGKTCYRVLRGGGGCKKNPTHNFPIS